MFLVATLLVILSLNVLNQSTHGQESDDSISDDSIKKDLLVSMKPLKLSVGDGDEEKFVVTVTDSDSQLISDVKIYGSIIYPDGTHKHTFQGITDENGIMFFL